MKATLEFDLPDEREEFEMATNGATLSAQVQDFDNWLRSEIKHLNREELQEIRDKFHEMVEVWS